MTMEKDFEYQPMTGFLKYSHELCKKDIIKIDSRINTLKKGEAKDKKGKILEWASSQEEIFRLKDLKTELDKAATKVRVSAKFLDPVRYF